MSYFTYTKSINKYVTGRAWELFIVAMTAWAIISIDRESPFPT